MTIEGRRSQRKHRINMTAARIPFLVGALVVVSVLPERAVAAPVEIAVRHFVHRDGRLNDSPDGGLPTQTTGPISVDPETLSDGRCRFRLQRTGGGRARMWNARLPMSGADGGGVNDANPVFGASSAIGRCTGDRLLFVRRAEDRDRNQVFNEQQTFVWAQRLKTQLDNWGRKRDASRYGYYPPKEDRDVNAEIVVNAPRRNAKSWCNQSSKDAGWSPQHGCFAKKTALSSFPGTSGYFDSEKKKRYAPAVFLYNETGNNPAKSPQFMGAMFSPSYSIVAHEVGHFIQWTYGDIGGAGTTAALKKNMTRSLHEGFAMALAALFGKATWPKMRYARSGDVTTGSKNTPSGGTAGRRQWKHHDNAVEIERYSAMKCGVDPYKLAWPWVQAMWDLANNRGMTVRRGVVSTEAIWRSSQNAIDNTADLLMWFLSANGDKKNVSWKTVAWGMLKRMSARIKEGKEQGRKDRSSELVREVLKHHGLLDNCQNPKKAGQGGSR